RGCVQMTVKVEGLAALVAGARVAGDAVAAQPGGQTGELERILGDFDRASRALQGAPEEAWFHAGSRSLQERFGTRQLADRITEKFVKDRLEPDDRAFVERADMFFLVTADGQGEHGRPLDAGTIVGPDAVPHEVQIGRAHVRTPAKRPYRIPA